MKSVMISIKPKWCALIANGKKTFEVRKARPKIEVPFKCYIYCTKGGGNLTSVNGIVQKINKIVIDLNNDATIRELNGSVIGEFMCDTIISHCESSNADIAELYGCIKREQLFGYSKGKELYGWHISDLVIYDEPKELSEFIHPSNGCCNEGKCYGCKYFDCGNGYNLEDDCLADFDTDAFSIMKRPPQSWCYVEELK